MVNCSEIEKSIIKKFRKQIWSQFTKAVKEYKMIGEGDRVCACISGGKDSMLLAKCLQELQKHGPVPFELKFLVMDPGYNEQNRQRLLENAEHLQLLVEIFNTNVFDVAYASNGAPCYLCARMRRGYLYSHAQALGCNKIALGHHFNDVIETLLLSMLYGSEIKGMMPKLHSTNFPGMELIRPLYYVHEEDIIRWANTNELEFLACACRFTEQVADKEMQSKRKEIKALIAELKKTNPNVDMNLFRSMYNVNIQTFIGWKDSEGKHSFLDNYDANTPKKD